MLRKARYMSNVVAQGTARFAFMVSTMLVFVLCARHLGVEGFGTFSYYMAYVAVVGLLADAGTTAVLARELAARRNHPSVAGYFGNFILVRIALGIGAAAAAMLLSLLLMRGAAWTLIAASIVAPIGAARFFDPVFQIFDRPWRNTPIAIATSAIYLCGSIAVLVWAPEPVLPLLLVYGLSGSIYLVLALWMSRDLVIPRLAWNPGLGRAILAMTLPLAVATIFGAANGRIGILLLAELGSPRAVGSFSAAAKLVEVGSVVALTLSAPLLPIFVASAARPGQLRRTAQSVFETLATLAFPAVILLWQTAPWLLTHIYGSGYTAAEPIARILVWQLILVPFSLVGSAVMLAANSIRFAYWTGVAAVAVNVLLNACLIPVIGAQGTAVAAVAADAALSMVMFYFLLRDVGNPIVARTWVKIGIFNAVLFALLQHPLFEDAWINATSAILVYAGLALIGNVIPHRQLWMVFNPAAEEPS